MEPPQRFTLKSQTESIQLESLLKQKFPQLENRIEGKLNFRGQFEAATQNGPIVTRTLQGSGESVIHHGTIRDFNLIAKIIPGGGGDSASSAGSSRLPASLAVLVDRPNTPFDTLKANFKVEGQRIRTDDVLLVTPDYTITGAGWVGFDRTSQWNGLLVLSPRITQELQREYKLIRYLLDRTRQTSHPLPRRRQIPKCHRATGKPCGGPGVPPKFSAKAGEPAGDKGIEKNERKNWLPESLEHIAQAMNF